MTEKTFETAYILRDKINKLIAVRNKLKREFPEWNQNHDEISKEIGMKIMAVVEMEIQSSEETFKEL